MARLLQVQTANATDLVVSQLERIADQLHTQLLKLGLVRDGNQATGAENLSQLCVVRIVVWVVRHCVQILNLEHQNQTFFLIRAVKI